MKRLISITLSIIMLISAMAFIAPTPARAETLAQNTPTMRALRADELSPYVDATTALSHGHVARVPAEEDLNTIVYRNLDGTKTAYFFDYNVKYVDENGQTMDKDITLATKAGGFGLTQSDISLTIPTDITNGVEFTHNGNYIKLTPVRENIIGESLSQATAALNKPQSAVKNSGKNEISYQKAFGNGTSLRYVPTMDGVKEEIILSSYNGTNQWRFFATTNGLKPYLDANGTYYFAESEDSDEKYSLGNVYTYDSAGNYTYGTMTVTEVKPAQQYVITLNVDENFLTSISTVYPVYVDPTITVSSEGLYDTVVYSNYPTTNYGTNQSLRIGRYIVGEVDYGTARVLLKAQNLINNGTFYTYMDTIVSAELALKVHHVVPGKTIAVHRITNTTWTESNATWNSVGNAYNSTVLMTFTPTNSAVVGNYKICVTNIVSSWRANESYLRGGLLLKMADESNVTDAYRFNSSETNNGPTLTIQYQTDISDHFNTSVASTSVGATTSIVRSQIFADYVTFSSRNDNIATVNQYGVITGVANGETHIDIEIRYDSNNDGDLNDLYDEHYVDECRVVICPIPISGYELEYEPNEWNVSPIQSNTNCYAYAVNAQVLPNSTSTWAEINPGEISDVDGTLVDLLYEIHSNNPDNDPYLWKQYYEAERITYYFTRDMQYEGYFVSPIDRDEQCAAGHYKIAIFLVGEDNPRADFHFYRQNSDGTWSHKRGEYLVTNLDASYNVIYDPENCNRRYGHETDGDRVYYDIFVGYFEIAPWNSMYTG